jgi:hypothetical protein
MSRRNQPLITGPPWLCRMVAWIPIPLAPGVSGLIFELEGAFGVQFRAEHFPWQKAGTDSTDFTAGELHEWVCACLLSMRQPVPTSSWHRVQHLLAHQTGTPPRLVRRETYVSRDLRFFEGG